MTDEDVKKDLVVLVADKDTEMVIKGILERTEALQIKEITYDVFIHSRHDPGCLLNSHIFLQAFLGKYSYALVLFDRQGCGKDSKTREELERDVEKLLNSNGWSEKSKAIVIDPELETWVWKNSPHVSNVLGWHSTNTTLYDWLREKGFLPKEGTRPPKPKEVMEAVLRYVKKPRSSSIYNQLANKVSLKQCDDPSFLKLRSVLQGWFPIMTPQDGL